MAEIKDWTLKNNLLHKINKGKKLFSTMEFDD